ncbi:MAG: hypothetical protein OXD41_01010 [Thaumarchaeota archaeon]|nr:hypothetical protein [Nitrososphaerota archaeon]
MKFEDALEGASMVALGAQAIHALGKERLTATEAIGMAVSAALLLCSALERSEARGGRVALR